VGFITAMAAASGIASASTLGLSISSTTKDDDGFLGVTIEASGVANPPSDSIDDELDVFTASPSSACADTALDEELDLDSPSFDTPAYPGFAFVNGPFSQSFQFDSEISTANSYLVCGYLSVDSDTGPTDAAAQAVANLVPPPSKPTAPVRDALKNFGASSKTPPYFRLYAFTTTCAALPCRIKLTERAFAGHRRLPRLDKTRLPMIVQRSIPKKGVYAVWFQRHDFDESLLAADIKRYGAVELRVTGRILDSRGGQSSATRTIVLHAKPKPAKPAPVQPPTQLQKIENAVTTAVAHDPALDPEGPDTYYVVGCRQIGPTRWSCTLETGDTNVYPELQVTVDEINGRYYVGQFENAP